MTARCDLCDRPVRWWHVKKWYRDCAVHGECYRRAQEATEGRD